ncbi:MAG: RluA family pseudouridine synthase [Omnitrophica bacterium]|nr:RluA family pseudouridine synthase [Candidatus Omnitrophota bacterium]
MEELNFKVEKERAGGRLDKFLVGALRGRFSRSFIKKLVDDANVEIEGKVVCAHYKVCPGDSVNLKIPDPKPLELTPENIPLDVAYEDGDLLVINKQPGLTVHPAGPQLTGTLVNALLYHCKDLSGIGGVLRPGIVHRLDKDTSGFLVVAKNDKTHLNLSGQFKNRTAKRKYIALVKGIVQLDRGRIELPIARRKKDINKMGISFADTKKKNAITNYLVLKRFKDFTMLEVALETGRTHQIRVHLSHMGHAILGDRMYGSQRGIARQALHAKTLGFFHPATKKFMEFDSAIPRDMQDLIDRGKV